MLRDLGEPSQAELDAQAAPIRLELRALVFRLAEMAYPGCRVTGDVFLERIGLLHDRVPEALRVDDWKGRVSLGRWIAYRDAARTFIEIIESI